MRGGCIRRLFAATTGCKIKLNLLLIKHLIFKSKPKFSFLRFGGGLRSQFLKFRGGLKTQFLIFGEVLRS